MAKTVFMVIGANLEIFLSAVKNIKLLEVSRQGQALYAKCNQRDIAQLKKIAQMQNLEFNVLMQNSRPIKYLLWSIILSGLLLTVFWATRFWTFVYVTDDLVWAEKIHNYLGENGLKPGSVYGDYSHVTEKVFKAFPEITFFDLKKDGIRLKIDFKTKDLEKEKAIVSEIKTTYGGIVHYVNVILGESLVKPGDVVYPGQIVIQGNPQAEGQVFGETVVEVKTKVLCEEKVRLETGNKEKVILIKLGSKEYRWGSLPNNSLWRREEHKIGWAGNRRQFVEITIVIYHELSDYLIRRSKEEAEKIALEIAGDTLKEIVKNSKVFDVKTATNVLDDAAEVQIKAKIETDLTKERSGE